MPRSLGKPDSAVPPDSHPPGSEDPSAATRPGLEERDAAGASGAMRASSPAPFPQTPDFLLDVRLTVSVEIGRTQMPIRQVMELGPGSVIELPRSASEPVEVFANGRCIARGEIVVVGEHFGVRLTELGDSA
jgi:flagellar motor switch protein FliN/FliY